MSAATWTRTAPGVYTRADGVSVRKNLKPSTWWTIRVPSGAVARAIVDGQPADFPAGAPTLAIAQWLAEDITPDTPTYTY